MVTRKVQFEALKPYFDAEEKRYEQLGERATVLLSVVAGLSLYAGIHSDDFIIKLMKSDWTLAGVGITGISLLITGFATTMSLGVRDYKDVCNLETIVVDIDKGGYEEEDLFSVLLACMADATQNNRQANDCCFFQPVNKSGSGPD